MMKLFKINFMKNNQIKLIASHKFIKQTRMPLSLKIRYISNHNFEKLVIWIKN